MEDFMETESAWDTQSVFPHFKAQDLELGFNHADDVNDVVDQAFEGESASLMSEEPCETPTSPPSARRLAQPARARQPLVEVKCEPSRVSRADRMREDDKLAKTASQHSRARQREHVHELEGQINALEAQQNQIRDQRDALRLEHERLLAKQRFLRSFLERAVLGAFPPEPKPKHIPIKQEPAHQKSEKAY